MMDIERESIAIRCEGLSKTYGRIVALHDLDLAVEAGTIFGFLGPNGAGKTTTIRLLVGLARPTRGRSRVAGHEVTANGKAARQLIGYLPEEPAFYPWMTGAEFLDYVGRLFGLSGTERKKRVDGLLDLAGLREASRRRVGGYSRGMRQRLGVAQALINRPQVLILDEPASALDPQGRRDVLTLIEQLREQATVFMSTHILSDVERVCDRVAIIDRGRLVVEADREGLQNRYAPPVFELAWDEGDNEQTQVMDFVHLLEGVPWVSQVERQSRALRVHVSDREQARRELLSLVAQRGLVLSRYELVKPTLEDVFLRLVDTERQLLNHQASSPGFP
jgi:ABC-2 type transport system ATP-binding protein